MPQVKTHQIVIRGHSDIHQFVPAYELKLALRHFSNGLQGAKKANGKGCEEVSMEGVAPALRTRNIKSVDREWTILRNKYGLEMMDLFYPNKEDFIRAVEKEMLLFTNAKDEKAEIIVQAKKLGLTEAQAKRCSENGLNSIAAVKAADLAQLSNVLELNPADALALRQKWWGDTEPVVIED